MRWRLPVRQSRCQRASLPYGGCVRRYVTERNERWVGFEHRPGDVVISTRPHRDINERAPSNGPDVMAIRSGHPIERRTVCGGLINEYRTAA